MIKSLKILSFCATIGLITAQQTAWAAVTTSGAVVTAIRVHSITDAYVRIETDVTLNCGARLTGSETRRAYIYAPGTSPSGAASQDDLNRIQSIATAALLSGKTVTVVVDETATTGVYASSCKLVDLLLVN
jgi:hypothetical protein